MIQSNWSLQSSLLYANPTLPPCLGQTLNGNVLGGGGEWKRNTEREREEREREPIPNAKGFLTSCHRKDDTAFETDARGGGYACITACQFHLTHQTAVTARPSNSG